MQVRSIYIGATVSVLCFVAIIVISQVASDWVSQYPILTDGYLGLAAASVLGCAYFLPRAVGAFIRSRK
jgi:hypothetical protein